MVRNWKLIEKVEQKRWKDEDPKSRTRETNRVQ